MVTMRVEGEVSVEEALQVSSPVHAALHDHLHHRALEVAVWVARSLHHREPCVGLSSLSALFPLLRRDGDQWPQLFGMRRMSSCQAPGGLRVLLPAVVEEFGGVGGEAIG